MENRRRLFDAIAENPGLHARELARKLDMHHSLVDYHLRFLLKGGLVVESRDEGFKRYHAAYEAVRERGGRGLTIEERRWLGVLRRGRNVEIAVRLIESPGQSLSQLAEAVGLSISTLSSHVKRMERAGLVTSERRGKEKLLSVPDPQSAARLILLHTWKRQDLVEGFREVWQEMDL